MICLDFAVSGLMLKKKQYTYLVAGTKNCISIKVKLDRHWQDLEVFAVCYRDSKEYPYAITNGECLIADMAVISTSGEFKLKLLGSTADGNVVITTNVVTVYINDNKFSGAEGGELEYPTSDYLAEVLAGSKQAAEQAKLSADVTDVQVGDKVISLPNSISLKSAGSVYDSLEFYEQNGKYYQRHTQRVGVVPSIELASCQVERVQSHDIPCFVMICDKLKERSKPIQTIQINRYTSAMETGRHVDVDMMCINDGASAYNLCWRNDSIQSAEAFQKHLVDDDITIYYELATPIVTVTEVDNRFDAVDCKAGDKITFVGNSDYHLPVPNEEEYLIALNEVTA